MDFADAMLCYLVGQKIRMVEWSDHEYISKEEDLLGITIYISKEYMKNAEWEIYHASESEPDYGVIISHILEDAYEKLMSLSIFSKE